jgi:enoyl-CoA hydratase
MSAAEVICAVEGAVGRLTLDRPQALHALTTNMVEAMTAALLSWRRSDAIAAVLIDHAGERGFCAGGDIRFLAASAAEGGAGARDFFFKEYRLNHLLMALGKPVVVVMDGVTMGGGVGLAMPARFRIATERTRFAMPESGIGLFPDVGGGWHLPRLPGRTGLWLALSGARLGGADCLDLGIATHLVRAEHLAELKAAILHAPDALETTLATFAQAPPAPAPVAALRPRIDRLYAGASLEEILAALKAEGSEFAKAELTTLATKSPLTLKTAVRELAEGAARSGFAEEMVAEMRIGARIVMSHDFTEGVRAVIVDKDNAPRWSPATPEEVTPVMLDAIFAPLPADQEWSPLPELQPLTKDTPLGL